jgi:hypothetical protein
MICYSRSDRAGGTIHLGEYVLLMSEEMMLVVFE